MRRFSAVLVALACLTIIALPTFAANEGSRYVEPYEYETHGIWAYPPLEYHYSHNGYVEIGTWVRSDFSLEEGAVNFGNGGEWTFQEFSFHQVEDVEGASWFTSSNDTPPIWTTNEHFVFGRIWEPGLYEVDILLASPDGDSVFTKYRLYLPSFDFENFVCIKDRRSVVVRYSIDALVNLPSVVDSLRVENENGRGVTLYNLPISPHGTFASLELPLNKQLYRRLLAGKVLWTSMTINGETVRWRVLYPHLVNARDTC